MNKKIDIINYNIEKAKKLKDSNSLSLFDFFLFPQMPPMEGTFSAYEISRFGFEELENIHNWVQWAFPIYTESQCVKDSPHLSKTIKDILIDKEYKKFYENTLNMYWDNVIKFFESGEWINHPHNYLRITRILTSLDIFLQFEKMNDFYAIIIDITTDYVKKNGSSNLIKESKKYWLNAYLGHYSN